MKAEDLDMKGCTALASAIVAQAGLDYLKIKKKLDGLKDGESRKILEAKLEDIERFFESRWYRDLTEVKGDWLKEQLDKYYDELKKNNNLKEIDTLNLIRP